MYLGSQWIHKTAYGRISTKLTWGPCCTKKGLFTAALEFGTQIYSNASSHKKIQQQKAAVDKEWAKLERFRCGIKQKSETNLTWLMKQKGAKSSLTSVIWSCIPQWYCKKTSQGVTQYSPNKDHQHLKWQQQKSWISSPDCQVAQDKQLTQYLLLPC